MPSDPNLIAAILGEFRRILAAIGACEHTDDDRPPKFAYVEQRESAVDAEVKVLRVAAWLISMTSERSCALRDPKAPTVSRRFHDLLWGAFTLAPDGLSLIIEWQAGPLYGRGTRHRFGRDANGVFLLARGESVWVS